MSRGGIRARRTPRALPGLLVLLALAAPQAAPAITRDRVMANAAAYAEHRWTCREANTHVDCSATWSSDYGPGDYVGLPYDWGGYKTLPEFDADLAAGQGAGSHTRDGVLECTTGVDCSGYVSSIWETAHRGTSGIPDVCDRLAVDQLVRADALDDPGSHVVLFSRLGANGGPEFYEASGSASKVRLHTGANWSYLDGYIPLRYRYISDEPDSAGDGTLGRPIRITAFPFDHDGDTGPAASRVLDRYSCAIHTFEAGPEIVYAFDAAGPGHLTASVSDGADVDVDVHLLGAPDEDHCLARDDTQVDYDLPGPGIWYLVADSWTNADGIDFPGPYHLHAEFSGALVPPGGEDAGTGEDGGPDGEDAGLPPVVADLGPAGPGADSGATRPELDLGSPGASDAGISSDGGWLPEDLDAGAPRPGADTGARPDGTAPSDPRTGAADVKDVGCASAAGAPAPRAPAVLLVLLLFLLPRR